jgi:hypothetical protein
MTEALAGEKSYLQEITGAMADEKGSYLQEVKPKVKP